METKKNIYNILLKNQKSGISAKAISNELKKPISTVSGILSHLKSAGTTKNNYGLWYLNAKTVNVLKIINRLNSIGYDNKSWCEGYVSSLADFGFISEFEFEYLIRR